MEGWRVSLGEQDIVHDVKDEVLKPFKIDVRSRVLKWVLG